MLTIADLLVCGVYEGGVGVNGEEVVVVMVDRMNVWRMTFE
jgi:hypothetical protein